MTEQLRTSYDTLPYPKFSFPQTHPDRLGAMAKLFGVSAVPPERARVLELGCASGANLLPMAESLPQALFLGIDFSSVQIESANQLVRGTDCANIQFRCQDIRDFQGEQFDYIICHGVFSWVPPAVQDAILRLCAQHLSPSGVAYVSYNTYPGWHFRTMIRDMIGYHARNVKEHDTVIREGRALLDFIASAVSHKTGPYAVLLENEVAYLRQVSDAYLSHDHLEEFNSPLYFHQFIERANAYGLKYLAETDLPSMQPLEYPAAVQDTLRALSQNQIVQMEQYLDFLHNRMFRCTLLLHQNQRIVRKIAPDALLSFLVSTDLRTVSGAYETGNGRVVQLETEQARELIDTIREASPHRLPVSQLPPSSTALLLEFVAKGLVDLHLVESLAEGCITDTPLGSSVARAQAQHSAVVTNLHHENIALTPSQLEVLHVADGLTGMTTMVDKLEPLFRSKSGKSIFSGVSECDSLRAIIKKELLFLAQNALLKRT